MTYKNFSTLEDCPDCHQGTLRVFWLQVDENAPKRKYVFVVKDGKVKMIEAKTGVSDTTHVAIVSGVKLNDQVVTGPFRVLKKLHDGDAVEVTKEETHKAAEASS